MKEIHYDQRMQGGIRIGISAALGLFIALATLMVFYGENMFGPSGLIAALILITTLVAYAASFGTNIGISAVSCSGIQVGKIGYASAIPAAFVLGITVLYILVESWSGAFGFIFDTVRFPSALSLNWKTGSVVGLLFALFWGTLYGQLIGGSMVEMC